jgi:hypothetical protein
MLADITIMDRAVYDMGAQAGAEWIHHRLQDGKLADIRDMLNYAPKQRAILVDKLADVFGLGASAGGMVWHQYKSRAYAAGWLAGFNAALIEETQHSERGDILIGLLAAGLRA